MLKANLRGISMENYILLEKGDYPFQIVAAEEKISKSGNNMIVATFAERKSGTKITDYFVLKENCLSKVKRFLRDIGQPYDEDDLSIDCKEWIGLWVMGNVIIEEYTKDDGTIGKSNKIRYFTAFDNKNISMVDEIKEKNTYKDLDEEVPF